MIDLPNPYYDTTVDGELPVDVLFCEELVLVPSLSGRISVLRLVVIRRNSQMVGGCEAKTFTGLEKGGAGRSSY